MAYVFQPYPKWIELPDGTRLIVQSEGEETAMLEHATKPEPAPAKAETTKAK